MPARLDPTLLGKVASRTQKSVQYVREQVSKRAGRQHISSEAALVLWASGLGIATGRYVNKLSPEIRNEIRMLKLASPLQPTRLISQRNTNTPKEAKSPKNKSGLLTWTRDNVLGNWIGGVLSTGTITLVGLIIYLLKK